ncbi:MAG: AAA family ATPase [Deltaproteobacteria bacterium]|nr:AAA family ATPase [Deltaproteobacteria bacterium]
MKQSHKTLLLWVLLIVIFLAIWQLLSPDRAPVAPVKFSEFMAYVGADRATQPHLESVEIRDREYVFWVVDKAGKKTRQTTIGPEDSEAVAKELIEKGIPVSFEKEEGSSYWSGAIVTIVPMLLLLGMFYLFMRQLQVGGGKAMSFGKSRARMLNESTNKVTFDDVAGIDEAKDEVEEIIEFLKDPKKFQRLGGHIPKGVLVVGPPGTGKTLLARAIAGEAGVPFFSISGSDFVEMFVGVGASRVRDLFEQGKKHAPPDVDLEVIARGTPGFVGADLENLVNEAALLAARQDKEFCAMLDFELAKDKVLMGTERRSMVIGEDEKRSTAWHEGGHTVIAKLLEGRTDPVHKVTIIPRGPSLGQTQQLPKADRLSMSKAFAEAKLAVLMGGRAAEDIVFGCYTTGAAGDIKQATALARRMVTEFGMSDALGPVAYGQDEGLVFLGRDITSRQRDYSESTAQLIDEEVKALVNKALAQARGMLVEQRALLDKMAEALLERETLDAEEIDAIVAGRDLPVRARVVIPTYRERAEAAKEKRRAASIFGAPKPAPSV